MSILFTTIKNHYKNLLLIFLFSNTLLSEFINDSDNSMLGSPSDINNHREHKYLCGFSDL